jgi:NAD(P)-dependent dehydrogenase (short-subunit alcohol dehydrogenase family)
MPYYKTVRKPPNFYAHLMNSESNQLHPQISQITHVIDIYQDGGVYKFVEATGAATTTAGVPASKALMAVNSVHSSAALSQLAVMEGDEDFDHTLFPPGIYDRDEQQVDLRLENSWILNLGEISTTEMIECQVINVFAPWILISELKPLLQKSTAKDGRYIVNVSAMEGQFYRNKTAAHPHSNMAKGNLTRLIMSFA